MSFRVRDRGHRALYTPALVSALVAIAANAMYTAHVGLHGALLAYGLTQVTLATLTVGAFYRTPRRDRALTTLVREAIV